MPAPAIETDQQHGRAADKCMIHRPISAADMVPTVRMVAAADIVHSRVDLRVAWSAQLRGTGAFLRPMAPRHLQF